MIIAVILAISMGENLSGEKGKTLSRGEKMTSGARNFSPSFFPVFPSLVKSIPLIMDASSSSSSGASGLKTVDSFSGLIGSVLSHARRSWSLIYVARAVIHSRPSTNVKTPAACEVGGSSEGGDCSCFSDFLAR